MKHNLQVNPLFFKITFLVTCFMLVILYNNAKAADVKPAVRSSKVTINFKHDTKSKELSITVKGNNETSLQLFIFSPEGLLIKEVAVSAQKVTKIKSLDKGYYMYECFNKDARLKSGNLIID
ncbi:MAG: hypothetical protein ABIN67_24260 [Ferruginibacter sp.]